MAFNEDITYDGAGLAPNIGAQHLLTLVVLTMSVPAGVLSSSAMSESETTHRSASRSSG